MADQLVNMVLVAGLYVVRASGLGIIHGVMRVINLGHAGVIMLGAHASYWLFSTSVQRPYRAGRRRATVWARGRRSEPG